MTLEQLERLEQIEAERLDTMLSDNFIQWMKDLNISRLYTSPESKINAREMNSQYDFSKKKKIGRAHV